MASVILLIVGAAMVLWGADKLTDAACAIARRFGISEMVIGLTVVSMGTSLPEFCISISSALSGSSDISVGNIVGSNIFNVLVIVGLSALLSPISVSRSTVTKDIPFAVLAAVVFCIMAYSDRCISTSDGLILLCFFVVFMWYTFTVAGDSAAGTRQEDGEGKGFKTIALGILGIAALIFGGDIFVDAATSLALALGVSEMMVGLTIVAVGTSLPELATSAVAARKGQSAIAIGSVIGSNLFNIFLVMGLSSTIIPTTCDGLSMPDLALLLVSVLAMWAFARTKYRVARWEGAVMLAMYAVYTCLTYFININPS